MHAHRALVIPLLISLSQNGTLSQSGPNDFDVQAAMDVMGIEEGMVIGEAGFKNITVDTTLKYDNIYLAKKSD